MLLSQRSVYDDRIEGDYQLFIYISSESKCRCHTCTVLVFQFQETAVFFT